MEDKDQDKKREKLAALMEVFLLFPIVKRDEVFTKYEYFYFIDENGRLVEIAHN